MITRVAERGTYCPWHGQWIEAVEREWNNAGHHIADRCIVCHGILEPPKSDPSFTVNGRRPTLEEAIGVKNSAC